MASVSWTLTTLAGRLLKPEADVAVVVERIEEAAELTQFPPHLASPLYLELIQTSLLTQTHTLDLHPELPLFAADAESSGNRRRIMPECLIRHIFQSRYGNYNGETVPFEPNENPPTEYSKDLDLGIKLAVAAIMTNLNSSNRMD